MRTPGMMGLSGKCPGKKLSLMVTFLIATAETPGLYSITLSTKRNGNLKQKKKKSQYKNKIQESPKPQTEEQFNKHLWGKILRISLISMTVGKDGNSEERIKSNQIKSNQLQGEEEQQKPHDLKLERGAYSFRWEHLLFLQWVRRGRWY